MLLCCTGLGGEGNDLAESAVCLRGFLRIFRFGVPLIPEKRLNYDFCQGSNPKGRIRHLLFRVPKKGP